MNSDDLITRSTDKYVLSDYPFADGNLELVKTCRQQLRDYTNLDQVTVINFIILRLIYHYLHSLNLHFDFFDFFTIYTIAEIRK